MTSSTGGPSEEAYRQHVAELEGRLREAEETLDAIRLGEVDAVIVGGPGNQQVYTIENADRPYRLLVEQMREGAVTLSAEGTVLYCNRHLSELMEIPQERLTGASFRDFLPEGQRAAFADLTVGSARGGAKGEFTLRTGRDGMVPVNLSLVDLPDEGERILCGIVSDLTQRARREAAEEGFQTALDASGMGSWDLDLVRDVSRRSARHDEIFGIVENTRAWGRDTFLAQVVPADRRLVADAFAGAAVSGGIEFECGIAPADGSSERWIRVKGRTYYDEGRPIRMVGVVADITGQRQLQEQLRQAQKMEAVGQLTGGLAHDFNNLLTVILGNLELAHGRATDERLVCQIEDARHAARRGAGLTQQLLAFSRRQSLQPKAIRVADLLPGLADLIGRAIGDDIELTLDEGEDLWHCEVDPNQLESAILNLAINARDAMPDGGLLSISTANVSVGEAETMAHPGVALGSYVVVSVADTGEGMSPEVRARVFEPFFTTKDVGKGSGLGLSMVYGFVRQSLGHVVIESEIGTGTTIRLYLLWTPAVPVLRQVSPEIAPDPKRSALILVVEDDAEVRRLAVSLMHAMGHETLEAANGPDALTILADRSDIELLFTDVVMPKGMSGIDLARQARLRKPDLPILLTSGFTTQSLAEPKDGERPLKLLRKPYRYDELAVEIASSLAEAVSADTGQTGDSVVDSTGLRVLVVEDEPLIAMVLEDYLLDLGCKIVGPKGRLTEALAAADLGGFDVALLDVNIHEGAVYPVAEKLAARSVPFAFMTGSDVSTLPAAYSSRSNLAKPYSAEDVRRALSELTALVRS